MVFLSWNALLSRYIFFKDLEGFGRKIIRSYNKIVVPEIFNMVLISFLDYIFSNAWPAFSTKILVMPM